VSEARDAVKKVAVTPYYHRDLLKACVQPHNPQVLLFAAQPRKLILERMIEQIPAKRN
jgi:hypothetical protein